MPYQLKATRSALRELKKLPPEIQRRLREAIVALADEPRPPGCKKLKGRDDYAIRVGHYRVIYEIDDEDEIVLVTRAGHRREVYRDS